jgi:hypothetical protein
MTCRFTYADIMCVPKRTTLSSCISTSREFNSQRVGSCPMLSVSPQGEKNNKEPLAKIQPSLAFQSSSFLPFQTLHNYPSVPARGKNCSPAALPFCLKEIHVAVRYHACARSCLASAQLILQVVRHHALLHLLRPRILIVASLVATVGDRNLLGLLAVLGVL